jgi:L,D-transpeptidase YcbB
MISGKRRALVSPAICALFFMALGCRAQNAEAIAGQLRTIAAAGSLADLTWPNFPDYRQPVQTLYESVNYAPVWLRDGKMTPQAIAMISAFSTSRLKGLNPEEYDASRWPQRLKALSNRPYDASTVAPFDAALTVCTMRYISDLHIGRVNPKHFKIGLDVGQKTYDLPQFLAQKILPANNVP